MKYSVLFHSLFLYRYKKDGKSVCAYCFPVILFPYTMYIHHQRSQLLLDFSLRRVLWHLVVKYIPCVRAFAERLKEDLPWEQFSFPVYSLFNWRRKAIVTIAIVDL